MKQLLSTFTLALSLFLSPAFAQTFSSNDKHINLLELYTSEGCSSCPPADRWIGRLKHDSRLWSEFIPVVFHVDYWDYIGWKDPFAKTQFSYRQRQHSQQGNLSSVYTPGLLLNGKEWRAWRRQSSLSYPKIKAAGNLTIDISNNLIDAVYLPDRIQASSLSLNIAILGFDVKSEINSGENNGHTFSHDFVVIGYKKVVIQSDNGNFNASEISLPQLSTTPSKQALVARIDSGNNLEPLQATGGWLN